MEIKQGKVKYKNSEQLWTYSITEDGKQYYFLDPAGEQRFKNNTIIVTTNLKEAVDPMYASTSAMNIGLIDENGREVIPCTNKSIRPVNDSVILVEPAKPISPEVINAAATSKDFKHVALRAAIRDNFKYKLGDNVRFLFNDQFSEVTVCDTLGNNLVNGEYYSFVVLNDNKLYMSKNTSDSGIIEYSLVPTEEKVETPQTQEQPIDVTNVNVDNSIVDNALASSAPVENVNVGFSGEEVKLDESQIVQPAEVVNPVAAPSQEVVETPVAETASEEVQLPPQITADNETIDTPQDVVEPETTPVEAVAPVAEVVETPVTETTESTNEVVEPETTPVAEVTVPVAEVKEEEATPLEDVSSEEINIPTNEVEENENDDTDEVEEANDIDLDDTQEDTTLDNMFGEVSSARDVEDDMNEEIFSDSVVKTDSIEDDYEDYEENNYEDVSPMKDTTMEDIAKSMAALIKQNKELKSTNNDLTNKLEVANNSKNNVIKKNKMLEEKIDVLSTKNQSLDNKVIKLESKNDILENRVHDQERIIDSQDREIGNLKTQLSGKEKIDELLKAADEVLEDDNSFRDINYYRRIA